MCLSSSNITLTIPLISIHSIDQTLYGFLHGGKYPVVAFSCHVGDGLALLSEVNSLEILEVVLRFFVVALHPSLRPVLRAQSLPQVEEVGCLAEATLGASGKPIIALSLDNRV